MSKNFLVWTNRCFDDCTLVLSGLCESRRLEAVHCISDKHGTRAIITDRVIVVFTNNVKAACIDGLLWDEIFHLDTCIPPVEVMNAVKNANKKYIYHGVTSFECIIEKVLIEHRIPTINDEFVQYYKKYCKSELLNTTKTNIKPKIIPDIKDVIFNYPATIVFWDDGSKTVVKCQDGDIFDPEKGLAMAISKKALGNQGNYCNDIKKWLPEEYESSRTSDAVEGIVSGLKRKFTIPKLQIGKPNPVQKAYDILVDCRDNDNSFDIDTVIGYLGEALED